VKSIPISEVPMSEEPEKGRDPLDVPFYSRTPEERKSVQRLRLRAIRELTPPVKDRPICRYCNRTMRPVFDNAFDVPKVLEGYGFNANSQFCTINCAAGFADHIAAEAGWPCCYGDDATEGF